MRGVSRTFTRAETSRIPDNDADRRKGRRASPYGRPVARLYALYVLAATLGFRRGELLGLRWSDVDLNLGTIASTKTVQRVNGRLEMDDTKTEDSDNTIPLPKITQRVLIEHRD
jgi:integrase